MDKLIWLVKAGLLFIVQNTFSKVSSRTAPHRVRYNSPALRLFLQLSVRLVLLYLREMLIYMLNSVGSWSRIFLAIATPCFLIKRTESNWTPKLFSEFATESFCWVYVNPILLFSNPNLPSSLCYEFLIHKPALVMVTIFITAFWRAELSFHNCLCVNSFASS